MSIILQHRRAPVKFDPPTDAELAADAFDDRIKVQVGQELVDRLIVTFGAKRVAEWVRNIAAARGEVLE